MKRFVVMIVLGTSALIVPGRQTQAQSDVPRFEVGAQYSFMNFDTGLCCSGSRRRSESGFGGRFTFNFNKYIAAETQVDYFPGEDLYRVLGIDNVVYGRKTLTVAGVKAGTRTNRWGVFGKARPGFIHFSEAPSFDCVLSGPCPPQPTKTNFAFDVGGVFEYYPSRKVVLRFDAGDTIIHHQRVFGTTHQFQFSAGAGLRF